MEKELQDHLNHSFSKNFTKYKNNHNLNYQKLYKEILYKLSRELNNFHKLKLTAMQWSIIIGPWLDNILNIYF